MTQRTIGIDLAIRGDHIAQIFEDGRPVGRPIRFRHDPESLDAFVSRARAELNEGDLVQAIMEPTGMSWFPVAHRLADAGIDVARVKAWGRIASLIETAKVNGVEPCAYLKSTLEAIANEHPQNRIDDLLSWNFQPSS